LKEAGDESDTIPGHTRMQGTQLRRLGHLSITKKRKINIFCRLLEHLRLRLSKEMDGAIIPIRVHYMPFEKVNCSIRSKREQPSKNVVTVKFGGAQARMRRCKISDSLGTLVFCDEQEGTQPILHWPVARKRFLDRGGRKYKI